MALTGDAFWAAQLLNWLCGAAACVLITRLAEPEMGRDARWAAAWMLLFPTAFYMMLPYAEALFLALVLGFFLALRRGRYAAASLLGGLAALTRNAGVLLALPYVMHALLAFCAERRPVRGFSPVRQGAGGRLAARLSGVLGIASGTAVYLLVNRLTFGDPFVFLDIQRGHWQQSIGWFWKTAGTLAHYLFSSDARQVVFLWVPQLLVMLFAAVALYRGRDELTSPQLAYAVAAFFFALSATWLLSGARYMFALFPVFLVLARRVRGTARWWLGGAMAAAQVFLAVSHALGQYVF